MLRADSSPARRSLAEMVVTRGHAARLAAFVPDAIRWRLVGVGEQVVTASRSPVHSDDFRSEPSDSADQCGLTPSPTMDSLMIRAPQVAGGAFAGVDVIAHSSGRHYALGASFPCDVPQAEAWGKADVAGTVVDWLCETARPSGGAGRAVMDRIDGTELSV